MNETLINHESNEPTPEPKLPGRFRLLGGALVGVLIFTIILLLLRALSESPAYLALLFPGIVAIDMLQLSNNTNTALADLIAFIVSCLPSAILGSLVSSKKKTNR